MCTTCGCAGGKAFIGRLRSHPASGAADHAADGPAARAAPEPGVASGTAAAHGWRAVQAGRGQPRPPAANPLATSARPVDAVPACGHPSAAAPSPGRRLRLERDILARNDALAAANRRLLAAHAVFALNLVSSPGAGKTALLVRTIEALDGRVPLAVIEGDQQTEFDAERIRATGAPALQINTGQGCHLDADMIGRALARMALPARGLLFIENVGNLVCPAAFDLGEAHKVAILSVTEGEDKPLKYPNLFAAADLLLINKVDLLPYLSFDLARAIGYARRINPRVTVIPCSATSGEGLAAWLAWLEAGVARAVAAHAVGADAATEPAR